MPSPALGAAPSIPARVAYGIALVTIVAAGVVPAHVAAKNLFVRFFKSRPSMLHGRSVKAGATWAAFVGGVWIVAWVIAESIPSFMNLLSLITSLFGSWFSYGLAGVLWVYLNFDAWRLRGSERSAKSASAGAGEGMRASQRPVSWRARKGMLTALNLVIIAIGAGIMGMGLYASGTEIHDDGGSGSWSCSPSS